VIPSLLLFFLLPFQIFPLLLWAPFFLAILYLFSTTGFLPGEVIIASLTSLESFCSPGAGVVLLPSFRPSFFFFGGLLRIQFGSQHWITLVLPLHHPSYCPVAVS